MVVSWSTVAMARGAKKYPKMWEKGVLAICSLRASGPTPRGVGPLALRIARNPFSSILILFF